mmetsp:Transcript_34519/g.81381  ORF Transcript_34519/g.81381 Transcript_34519/m.81381 type:complete len:266 (-) Transcript_34519:335-1132(-)
MARSRNSSRASVQILSIWIMALIFAVLPTAKWFAEAKKLPISGVTFSDPPPYNNGGSSSSTSTNASTNDQDDEEQDQDTPATTTVGGRLIEDPMRMRPNLPRFLPTECSEHLDELLPCWLDNLEECAGCVPAESKNESESDESSSSSSSLGSFLYYFKPPSMETLLMEQDDYGATCSQLQAPICPVTNCCPSCEEAIMELYECWLLVDLLEHNEPDRKKDQASEDSVPVLPTTTADDLIRLLTDECTLECPDSYAAAGTNATNWE